MTGRLMHCAACSSVRCCPVSLFRSVVPSSIKLMVLDTILLELQLTKCRQTTSSQCCRDDNGSSPCTRGMPQGTAARHLQAPQNAGEPSPALASEHDTHELAQHGMGWVVT